MSTKKIHALPFWIYFALTILFMIYEISAGLFSYLPSALFPLFWIAIYIIARVIIARRNGTGKEPEKEPKTEPEAP